MAVENEDYEDSYVGDGVTTAFAFDFRLIQGSDMYAYVNGVLQDGYSVYINPSDGVGGGTGGTVTFTSPPPSGLTVLLQRQVQYLQLDTFSNWGSVPGPTIETALDYLTMMIQQFSLGGFLPQFVAGAPIVFSATSGLTTVAPLQAGYALLDNGPGNPPSFGPVASATGGNVVGAANSVVGALASFADISGKTLAATCVPVKAGNYIMDNGPGLAPSSQAGLAGLLKVGGVLRGALTGSLRALPNIPTGLAAAPQGLAGSTIYAYKVVVMDATGVVSSGVPTVGSTCSAAAAAATIINGNALLNTTNYNQLTCNPATIANPIYLWYRIEGGTQQGYLGSTTMPLYNDQSMTVTTSGATAPAQAQWVGEFWHTGDFLTDSPVTAWRCRIYIDGNFTQQASHTITISTELAGATSAQTDGTVQLALRPAQGLGAGGQGSGYYGVAISAGGGGANGGYGGYGGSNTVSAIPFNGGNAYFIEHQLTGSGGGSGACGSTASGSGGAGGGALLIESSENVTLNANLTGTGANGSAGTGTLDTGGGGGSGGTVAIVCNTLTLAAITVNLNGGAGGSAESVGGGGGGGGGRFWARVQTLANSATITVTGGNGGSSGSQASAAGASGVADIISNIGYARRSAA